MRILVTGAHGSVGSRLVERLNDLGHEVIPTDLETMDVTNERQVRLILLRRQPEVIYHLAGAKHAPEGELDPWHVAEVNTVGTRNVLEARGGAKVIFASTCKACDPETAYGASKLIAERMVLNAGGVVCRSYNIPESCGNVFRLWELLPQEAPLPVTDCWRYFNSMEQVLRLLLDGLFLPSARYAVAPGDPKWMPAVAEELYPGRAQLRIPRRRGDRYREPLHAACERIEYVGSFAHQMRIKNPHDPEQAEDAEVIAA